MSVSFVVVPFLVLKRKPKGTPRFLPRHVHPYPLRRLWFLLNLVIFVVTQAVLSDYRGNQPL